MTILEAVSWARGIIKQGASSGMSEINATVRVAGFLVAELKRGGYVVEHTTVYPGRQRIQYTRRKEAK